MADLSERVMEGAEGDDGVSLAAALGEGVSGGGFL